MPHYPCRTATPCSRRWAPPSNSAHTRDSSVYLSRSAKAALILLHACRHSQKRLTPLISRVAPQPPYSQDKTALQAATSFGICFGILYLPTYLLASALLFFFLRRPHLQTGPSASASSAYISRCPQLLYVTLPAFYPLFLTFHAVSIPLLIFAIFAAIIIYTSFTSKS